MWRKAKIAIACWGTVVVVGIIFSVIFILLGMIDKIELFLYFNFTIGAALIFIIFWPFYSKRMK
jgi:hypothetical protein